MPQPPPTVFAEHELRRPFFSVYDPSAKRRTRILGTEYLQLSKPTIRPTSSTCTPATLLIPDSRDDGSGQSRICAFFFLQKRTEVQAADFIFDIGGSFQSLTTIFEARTSMSARRTGLHHHPFSLLRRKRTCNFFLVLRVLVEGNEQRYRLDFKEERRLWDANRAHLRTGAEPAHDFEFWNIIGELKERLHRWTRGDSTASSSTTPRTRFRSKLSDVNFTVGMTRPRFWNHCFFMFCIEHRLRLLTQEPRHLQVLPAR